MKARSLLAVAASALAAPAALSLPGSLSYLGFKTGGNYAPELALVNLTTANKEVLIDFANMSYESLFFQNVAYDWNRQVLLISLQYDANITDGLLLEYDLGARKVQSIVNTTYCWFVAVDAQDDNSLLCLTEKPFYSPPGRTPAAPLSAEARARKLRKRHGAKTAPRKAGQRPARVTDEEQEGYFVRIDRTTGASTYVSTWIDNAVSDNEAVTYDRAAGIIYAQMADDSDATYLVALTVTDGSVAAKTPLPGSLILFAFEHDRVSGLNYGVLANYSGSTWGTYFARLDLPSAAFTPIGPSTTFDAWTQLNAVTTLAPEVGLFFLTGFKADGSMWLLGVDLSTGALAGSMEVVNPFVDIHWHA